MMIPILFALAAFLVFFQFLRREVFCFPSVSIGSPSCLHSQEGDPLRVNMGKGASIPKPDKRKEMLQERLLRAQLEQARRKVEMPEIPATPPLEDAPPPPSTSSSDVLDAEEQARREALKRTNAQNNTTFAGETGALGGKSMPLG